MLYGVFLHAGVLVDNQLSFVIALVSDHFRMGTFFAISGFFAAMIARRKGGRVFVSWRLPILGIPLFFGLLVLNPMTFYLIHVYNGGTGSLWALLMGQESWLVGSRQDWHLHLWFLISLMIYVFVTPALCRLLATGWLSQLLDRLAALPGPVLLLAVATVVIGTEVGSRILLKLTIGNAIMGTPINYPLRATLDYLPYFMLGVAMFHARQLFERMHQVSIVVLCLGIGIEWMALSQSGVLSEDIVGVFVIVGEEITTVAALAALLFFFRKAIPGRNRLAEGLNGSIYTIYLVHYVLIYLVALTLLRGIDSPVVLQLSVAIIVILLGEGFHRLCVRRFAIAQLLFNGKMFPSPNTVK